MVLWKILWPLVIGNKIVKWIIRTLFQTPCQRGYTSVTGTGGALGTGFSKMGSVPGKMWTKCHDIS